MAASQVLLAGRAFATSKIVRARWSRTNAGLKADSRIDGIDGGYSSVAVGLGDRRFGRCLPESLVAVKITHLTLQL